AAGPSNDAVSPTHRKSSYVITSQYPDDPDMPELEDITYSDDEEDVGAEADFTNLETTITVSPISTTFLSQEEPKRVHQALKDPSWIEAMHEELLQFKMQKVWVLVDFPNGKRAIGHTQEEGIDYEEVFALVARIEAIRLFLAYASFKGFMVYQMDVKSAFLYETIEEKVYVCQPPGFKDPDYPDKIYVDDIIFGSTNKDLCEAFEKLMKDKFQMSSMGELTFFLGLQVKQKKDGLNVTAVSLKFLLFESIDCLPNEEIFTELSRMGTSWNEFSSSMALAVIRLSTGRKFNFSKYIFDSLVRNVDSSTKFYIYPQFLQLMIREKGFSRVDTPLFEGMIVAQQDDDITDEGAANVAVNDVLAVADEPTIPSHTPTTQPPPPLQDLPSTSQYGCRWDVTLNDVADIAKEVVVDAEIEKSADDDEVEPSELQEVVEDDVIDQVQRKEKEDNVVMRYQALKRKLQTEAQARKNMMIYLRNMAGFKMDYFKGMSYDDIQEDSKALKRTSESQTKKEAKKQKLDEEVEELKRHLQILPNDEDDVYNEATPLARKVPVVDYEFYTENNKPYYKIIRADGSPQLFLSF
nr:hypothetical protein [Tanacetum cinerariifolium]